MKNIGLGNKLRELRNAFGATQGEFADKLGVSRASINSYENNVNPIPDGVFWKIEQISGVGMEYFDNDDMDIQDAFLRYGVNPDNRFNSSSTQYSRVTCCFYDSLEAFYNNKHTIEPLMQHMIVLNQFFGLSEISKYVFIKAEHNSCYPFAKPNDTLIAVPSSTPKNNHLMIVRIDNELFLRFCRLNPITKGVKLIAEKDTFMDIDISKKKLSNVEFLGYVVNIFRNFQADVNF